jgi:hypothetical protein
LGNIARARKGTTARRAGVVSEDKIPWPTRGPNVGQTIGSAARLAALRCAVAASNSGPSNRPVVELLLNRGAVPDDHDLYLAGFAHDRDRLLPLLLARVPNLDEIAAQALAAPISNGVSESALSGTQIHPSCCSGVFVDQSAESVAAVELLWRAWADAA